MASSLKGGTGSREQKSEGEKKDEREDRKWGPKSLMNLRSNLTGRLSMNRWWCVLS